MNNQLQLPAERRMVVGKQVRQLRRRGRVPAVLYGHNKESIPLQVEREALVQLLHRASTSSILDLKVGRDRPLRALLKQMQVHPISGDVLHVDFYQVAANEKLRAQVPLRFRGEAPVAQTHDVAIMRAMDEVPVECYPADLPGAIEVDLARLVDLGSVIRAQDLEVGPKVTVLGHPEDVVVSVSETPKEAIKVLEIAAAEAEEAEDRAAVEAGETVEEAAKAA